MPTAYVNIGSNRGDRHAYIEQAVTLVSHIAESPVRRSTFIESEPWGYESQSPYINLGIAFTTSIHPPRLLDQLLEIEHSICPDTHRDTAGNYIDRAIDIDLIAVDDAVIDTPRLTLPHQRMHLRPFVLIPMLQLAPQWRHPILGLTPAALLSRL